MSKSRTMSAGNAGASSFIALNGNQGGGDKKQGLPSTIGRISGVDYNRSFGNNRDVVFYLNQIGGVGKGRSMFAVSADGVRKPVNIDTTQVAPSVSNQPEPEPEPEPEPPQLGSGAPDAEGNTQTPLNDITIYEAVNKWIADPTDPMFTEPSNFIYYGLILNWITSNVTIMSNLFKNRSEFNDNIGGWDTSSVTNMSGMFSGASSFNQNINSWGLGVGNVTDMSYMFSGASSFNGNIAGWDTSSVTNMSGMFSGASSFNQNIDNWGLGVGNVTDMSYMFSGASSFNQNFYTWNVGVGNVTNMNSMFLGATKFNGGINTWNVSNVTDMSNMFNGASSFDQYIRHWPTANVGSFENMFLNASAMYNSYSTYPGYGDTPEQSFFNQVYSIADISVSVEDWLKNPYQPQFTDPTVVPYYGDIKNWDTSDTKDMSNLFNGIAVFTDDISAWDVSNVTDMSNMFNGASSFDQYISHWQTANVISFENMFLNASAMYNSYSTYPGYGDTPEQSFFNQPQPELEEPGDTVDAEPTVQCLSQTHPNSVQIQGTSQGNVYIFNNVEYDDYKFIGLNIGSWTLTGIPSAHPIGFVINDPTLFEVTTGTIVNTGTVEGKTVNYYTGDITFQVKGDFGIISYHCYYHGYMGGQDRLKYSTECSIPIAQIVVNNSGASAYVIDGETNPTIYVTRGSTYNFNINALGHPFHIQISSGSYSSANEYSSGITGNGTENGTVTFSVPLDAPNTLYYVCRFHSSMRGVITIS